MDPSYRGKKAGAVGFYIKPTEMMKICTDVTGKTFMYVEVPRDEYANAGIAAGFSAAGSIANIFDYYRQCPDVSSNRSVEESLKLNPQLITSMKEWAEMNKEALLQVAGEYSAY